MNKLLIIAAAAAATLAGGATSFSDSAEAYGGVRVGFGFPLGSFVAKPTRGGGYGGGSSYGDAGMCKKKAAPSYASRKPRYEPKVVRSEPAVRHVPKAEPKVATKRVWREEPKVAYAKPKAYRPAKTITQVASEPETEVTETGAAPAAPAPAEVMGPPVPADLAPTAEPAATVAATEPVTTATPAPAATETPAPAPAKPAETGSKTKTAKKDDGCTKYIPAIGVTISVGC